MGRGRKEAWRDDAWLAERLRLLWEVHFSDVPRGYPITTRFGNRAKYCYGSIAARNGQTSIRINQLFADPFVPDYVVDATLAHELAHYAHGFHYGLPRLHAHAHRGGVVDKELERRGLGELYAKAAQWRQAHWEAFYAARCGDIMARRSAHAEDAAAAWERVLSASGSRTEEELRGRLALLAPRLGLAAGDTPPFHVEWLRATRRQTCPSYWFAHERTLRLHGLLADRRVPGVVVEFELAYWLARQSVGDRWQSIHVALCRAGLASVADEALRWRRHAWTTFRNRHHPLGPVTARPSAAAPSPRKSRKLR